MKWNFFKKSDKFIKQKNPLNNLMIEIIVKFLDKENSTNLRNEHYHWLYFGGKTVKAKNFDISKKKSEWIFYWNEYKLNPF